MFVGPDKALADGVILQLADFYNVPIPKVQWDCPECTEYLACFIWPANVICFYEGRVEPATVAHEFGHYVFYQQHPTVYLPYEASEAYAIAYEDSFRLIAFECDVCGIPLLPIYDPMTCPYCHTIYGSY